MQQRTAVLLGIAMTACAAAAVVMLSGMLAADRRAERLGYEQAMAHQRRAAGRALPAPDTPVAAPRAPLTVCVRGVDGFAAALRAAGASAVLDPAGRLDVAAFAALSDLAVRAERYVEQARGAPALPQRLGRARVSGPEGPAWQPLEPEQVPCGGGQAYAAVRLDVDVPARAEPGAGVNASRRIVNHR